MLSIAIMHLGFSGNSAGTGRTIAAHVAFAREYVLANDLFADDRFPEGTGWGDATLTSVICVPMLTLHDECSAVIELFRDNGVDYVEVFGQIKHCKIRMSLMHILIVARSGHRAGGERLDGHGH